jgi:hypothetical protein
MLEEAGMCRSVPHNLPLSIFARLRDGITGTRDGHHVFVRAAADWQARTQRRRSRTSDTRTRLERCWPRCTSATLRARWVSRRDRSSGGNAGG